MSHIVTIATKVRDAAAVAAACQRLGLPQPAQGTARLYSGEATGLLVQLPGWQYPVVIDPLTGAARYDNSTRACSATPLITRPASSRTRASPRAKGSTRRSAPGCRRGRA